MRIKQKSSMFWFYVLLGVSVLLSIAKLIWVQYFVSSRSEGQQSFISLFFDNLFLFIIVIVIGVGIALLRNKQDKNYQEIVKKSSKLKE